jgi:type II secretory pathway pseudopilin PulG
MRARRPFQSAAFTLVELLVVIVMITILAGMLLPAVNRVRIKALNARIAMEIKNMERGFEAYKEKYGDYPPDFTDWDVVERHVDTAWSHIERGNPAREWELFRMHAMHWNVSPAEALAFWLGGFSTNPKRPFTGKGGPFIRYVPNPSRPNEIHLVPNPDREPGVFEFDMSRVSREHEGIVPVASPFRVYTPPGRNEPYVYFDSRRYAIGYYWPDQRLPADAPIRRGRGVARPYLSTRPSPSSPFGLEWVNKHTFQIISAGLDGHYGSIISDPANPLAEPRQQYPLGANYLSPGDGDDDNIANFSEGGPLKDSKP